MQFFIMQAIFLEHPLYKFVITMYLYFFQETVITVSTLDQPNSKILPLIFMAGTLKELGVNKIYLIAPYLAYMRQYKRFHSGEAITSTIFAQLLSSYFDGMITIAPHLHRIHQLSEIYNMPLLLTLHATKKYFSIYIGVHALFNIQTENMLFRARTKQLITCNTIIQIHSTSQIDISNILAKGIVELC